MNLSELTIGIVGGGTVGRATAHAYSGHVKEVRVYDVVPERRVNCPDLAHLTELSNLIFICLPETEIDSFFGFKSRVFQAQCRENNWVLKSTVPIGTTRRLREQYGLVNLVHSPEFLTERTALLDASMPARNIIGFPGRVAGHPGQRYCLLNEVYLDRFPHVPCLLMSSEESEAVKLFTNGFYAVKVAYWNEVRTLADKLGLDWDTVMHGVLSGGTIHPLHTRVPGPDGLRGFGGKCLPKDLDMLADLLGTEAKITEAAIDRNLRDREVAP